MTKRRFNVTVTCEATIDIDEKLIASVDTDEWRRTFYQLETPKDVAHHLAYALIAQGFELQQLDGFADQPRGAVEIIDKDWFVEVE